MPDGHHGSAATIADAFATPRTGAGLSGVEAALLAHDLHNAIQAAVMHAGCIPYALHDRAQAERLVALVRQSLSHLADRVDVTLVARCGYAREDAALADVASLLRDWEGNLRVAAAGSQFALSVGDDRPLSVRCTEAELVDVVRNLVLNAAHASLPGSHVTVTCGRGPQAEADVLGLPARDYAVIRVVDDGAGMDAATLSRAREPRFTTKAPGQGSGLGLAGADRLAARHGGLLTLESAPMRGTVASVWLPLASRPAPPRCAG